MTRSKRGRSPEEWGAIVADLFNSSLTSYLSSATVSTLGKAGAVDILYSELRPFMTLKARLEAAQPDHELLHQPNSALLHFANRLFTTTHQALLNSIEAEDEEKRLKGEPLKRLRTQTEPTRELLLEWQMLRLKEARTQLFVALADLANQDRGVLDTTNLPETLRMEIEAVQS